MKRVQHDYAGSELAYKKFLEPSLIQAIKYLDIKDDFKILDVGCGPGAVFPYFADYLGVNGHIWGLDQSDAHLVAAEQTIALQRLQDRVTLQQGDLFEEILFDDDTFDLIWLSDVLFPDDIGEQNYSILQMLYRKLKPGGKIAIFYGNWLRLSLLPGYSILEHQISIANELRKSVDREWTAGLHPENALMWLADCGFGSNTNHYFTSSYQAPLPDHIKAYLFFHLKDIYGKAITFSTPHFGIAKDQIDAFFRIIDPGDKERCILNLSSYHCAAHAQLSVGTKRSY